MKSVWGVTVPARLLQSCFVRTNEYGVEREVIKNRAVVGRGRGSDATRRGDLRPIGEKESDL